MSPSSTSRDRGTPVDASAGHPIDGRRQLASVYVPGTMLEPEGPAAALYIAAAIEHVGTLLSADFIDLGDFDTVVGRVLAAQSEAGLALVLSSLPTVVTLTPSDRRLDQPLVLETRSGALKVVGQWQLGEHTQVRTTTGIVKVDLTEAQFDATVVELDLEVGTGIIDVVVPRGVSGQVVEMTTGTGIVANALETRFPLPGVPHLQIRARAGTGIIRLRHPKQRRRRRWFRRRRRRNERN